MDKVKNIGELRFKEDYNHCDHIVANTALLLGSLLFWFLNSGNWSLFGIIVALAGYYSAAYGCFMLHKYPLHNPFRMSQGLFDLHVNFHHKFFTSERLVCDEPKYYQYILMPTSVILALVLLVYPISYVLVSIVIGKTLAMWFLIGAQILFIQYELCHFASHTEHSSLLMLRHMRKMAQHHREHHRFQEKNFGIATDVYDRCFGTTKKS